MTAHLLEAIMVKLEKIKHVPLVMKPKIAEEALGLAVELIAGLQTRIRKLEADIAEIQGQKETQQSDNGVSNNGERKTPPRATR